MDCVLITTTINVPEVLRLYRQASRDTVFIVVGDRKTPHDEVKQLCHDLGNTLYLSDADQGAMGYECSELIGWNCIMRRNIALLEALRLRPGFIVTVDDDNIPWEPLFYFPAFDMKLNKRYDGPMVEGANGWFNIGDLFDPPFVHRGFPYYVKDGRNFAIKPCGNRRIGAVAGLWYGDPDVNAVERIVNAPLVKSMPSTLEHGILVEKGTFAPLNSQNTAYKFRFAPLMAVPPGIGRYDDIWGSYIGQRIMWEYGHQVYYGHPFVWQERNPQSAFRNLDDEVYGMKMTQRFCCNLEWVDLKGVDPVEDLAIVWAAAEKWNFMPERTVQFGKAWCKDLEKIL